MYDAYPERGCRRRPRQLQRKQGRDTFWLFLASKLHPSKRAQPEAQTMLFLFSSFFDLLLSNLLIMQ
jgi:hypothetical protein